MTTNSEYLAALPPEVQERLLEIVRTAADTDDMTKVALMAWLSEALEVMLKLMTVPEHAIMIDLLASVGQLLGEIYSADHKQVV